MWARLRELMRYRELLGTLVRRDFELKYKGSVFGVLWSQLNPLLTLAVYTFVFSLIFRSDIPNFPLYLMIGIIPWNFFVGAVSSSSVSIVNSGHLIRMVYFPRELVPMATVLLALVDCALSSVIILFGLVYFGVPLTPTILAYPALLGLQAAFCMGLALLFSTATVYFRDTKYLLDVFLFLLFFLTPIFYRISSAPSEVRTLLELNPMAAFISAYRSVLLYGQLPGSNEWLVMLSGVLATNTIGFAVFSRRKRDFAEEV